MASVGQVYYDVLPNLDGFAAKVASGLGNAKPIKIPVQADTKAAEASFKNLTSQTGNLSTASARLATAQGKVRVTAAQLNEVRQKATQGSSRLVSAEERYAKALRGVQTAQEQDAKAAARAVAVRDRASAASAKAIQRDTAARKQALQDVGSGLAVGGAAALAGLGAVAKVTADFDKAVSNVASTGKEARASLDELRASAIEYGAATSFSATEAANAQAELIKANVSVTDTINGGLKGALDLAAAGSLGVADAAGIMGTTMSQFKLSGTDASHVADLLAAAAGKAQGEVQDFAEALKYVGPVAQGMGVSIEETTGVLAMFANQGILGSMAGTALRSIMASLTTPIGAGAKVMKEYGINVRDASGQFIGMEGAAAELQKRLGGLGKAERDAAIAALFGKNAATAAGVFYSEGAEGVRKWTAAVDESGFAAQTAATKMDNLSGDVEKLRGALDSAFIQAGGGGTEFLRSLAQGAEETVNSFNDLSPEVQQGAFQLVALAAGAALATGAVIKIAGAGASAIATLTTLGVVGPKAAAGLSAVGAAGIAAGAGLAAVAAGNVALDKLGAQTKSADELADSLTKIAAGGGDLNSVFSAGNFADQLQGSLTTGIAPAKDLSSALTGLAWAQDTALGKFSMMREKITPGAQSLQQAEQQVGALDDALAEMVNSGRGDQAAEAVRRLGINGRDSARFLDDYTAAQKGLGDAAANSFRQSEIAFTNSQGAAAGAREIGAAAELSTEELKELNAEMYAMANAALALSGGQIAVEAAMDSAAAAAKRNGENLNISTAKGRENQTELDRLVQTTLSQTEAMVAQQEPISRISALNDRAKESWIDSAVAMGRNEEKAREMAESLFAIPEQIRSQVVVSGAKVSQKEARDLNRELEGIPEEQRARIVTIANTKGAKEAQREIAKVKSKEVIAKATGKGVNTVKEIDAAIRKLKSKAVRAQANSAGKPAVNALDNAIKALRAKRVQVTANTSGTGEVNGMANAIGRVHSKTVVVTVKTRGGGIPKDADGGTLYVPQYATGGTIRGVGGPREDNVAIMDRASGRQMAWGSVGEEIVNARQSAIHREQIKRINEGGKWDIVPRYAGGGTLGRDGGVATATRANRPLIINLDLGAELGGIRRIVTEIVDDRDEYTASIGRMR